MKFSHQLIFYSFVFLQLIVIVKSLIGPDCSCIPNNYKQSCAGKFTICGFASSKTFFGPRICRPKVCEFSYQPICAIDKNKKLETFNNPCEFLYRKRQQPREEWSFLSCKTYSQIKG